jgi:5-methylcytosine-specific restriction endonuclease McrA
LQHQNIANENGHITQKSGAGAGAGVGGGESFHKNHVANLMTLCEKCHDKIHKEKTMHKKVKTNKGTVIKNIYL